MTAGRARAALALICAASALTLVLLGTRLTFFGDDWAFLLQRPGFSADALLEDHNGHLSVLPVLIYKLLVALFGLDAQLPFRLVLSAAFVALGIVVYALVSARAGRIPGLVAAALLLFLGPAWEDLLWSFQMGFVGSLAAGLGALLALERDTPRRNTAACALLVLSLLLSDVGLALVVSAAVAVALRRRPAQAWILLVPLALFVVWFAAYGRDASGVSSSTLLGGPRRAGQDPERERAREEDEHRRLRPAPGAAAVTLGLRRFAPVGTPLGELPGRAAARIEPAFDAGSVPWRLSAGGRSTLQLCPA